MLYIHNTYVYNIYIYIKYTVTIFLQVTPPLEITRVGCQPNCNGNWLQGTMLFYYPDSLVLSDSHSSLVAPVTVTPC